MKKKKILNALSGKKHIIWDWNGTLLSDVDHCIETVNQLLAQNNLKELSREKYQEVFDFPVFDYYKRIGFDFSKIDFVDLSHRFVENYMSGVHKCGLPEIMKDVLLETRRLSQKQSILSASDQTSLDQMISHFEIGHLFDHIYGIGDKFAASKLERGRELLSIAAVAIEDTVLVGDTIHDLEVGKELGIDVVLLAHGHHSYEKLAKVHSVVIDD